MSMCNNVQSKSMNTCIRVRESAQIVQNEYQNNPSWSWSLLYIFAIPFATSAMCLYNYILCIFYNSVQNVKPVCYFLYFLGFLSYTDLLFCSEFPEWCFFDVKFSLDMKNSTYYQTVCMHGCIFTFPTLNGEYYVLRVVVFCLGSGVRFYWKLQGLEWPCWFLFLWIHIISIMAAYCFPSLFIMVRLCPYLVGWRYCVLQNGYCMVAS